MFIFTDKHWESSPLVHLVIERNLNWHWRDQHANYHTFVGLYVESDLLEVAI